MDNSTRIQLRRSASPGPPEDLTWGEPALSPQGLHLGRESGEPMLLSPSPTWETQPVTPGPGWSIYPNTALTCYVTGPPGLVNLSGVVQYLGGAPPNAGQVVQLITPIAPDNYTVHSVQWTGPNNTFGGAGLGLESGGLYWIRYWGNPAQGITWLGFSVFWVLT